MVRVVGWLYWNEKEGWICLENNFPVDSVCQFTRTPEGIAIAIHPAPPANEYWQEDDWVGPDTRYPQGGSTSAGPNDLPRINGSTACCGNCGDG